MSLQEWGVRTAAAIDYHLGANDYRCHTCKKRYRRFDVTGSCCVQHGPGECCHFMEQRITKKGYPKEKHR